MKFLKENVLGVLVIVLLTIIFIQRCDKPAPPTNPSPSVTIIRDTTWIVKDSVIYSKPKVINTIKDSLIYTPDTNYSKLLLQYKDVVNQLLVKNIHTDSIVIDTNGYVKIIDTVYKNLITGRSTEAYIKYPISKETVIIHPKPTSQIYVGGDVGGNKMSLINQVRVGILFKNRKDQIFTGSAGIGINGQPIYSVGSYWKIK